MSGSILSGVVNFEVYEEQSYALQVCLEHILNGGTEGSRLLIFAANAGSGKTYTANVASKILSSFGLKGTAIAYTGKAVTQLLKSGLPARTFHSLMYKSIICEDTGDFLGFSHRDINDIYAEVGDYIILDESSMIPKDMFEDLMKLGLPVVAVGDEAQLDAIDSKNPDFNIMELKGFPAVSLQVNRRTNESYAGIVKLSQHFRESPNIPRIKGAGLTMIRKGDIDLDFFVNNEFDGVIVGTNKTRKHMTDLIRKAKGFNDHVAEVGETVMCLRNTEVNGVYIANGEIFTVEARFPHDRGTIFTVRSVDTPDKMVNVRVMDEFWVTEKMPPMSRQMLEEYHQFTFGYAATCWKYQGSSLDRVLFVDEDVSFFANQKKFRYTATSRAAKTLVYAQ